MTTLHEENVNSRDSEDEHDSDPQTHAKDNMVEVCSKKANKDREDCSRTQCRVPASTSLNELGSSGIKLGTASPSIVSSGYGSQAASSSNLSSEDSLSLKSISVDETPETETNNLCELSAPAGVALDSLLSTPVCTSVQSISPGEDTDHTVTETTPSSTNITPSHSADLNGLNGASENGLVVRRNNLNHKTSDRRTLSQRLSCPNNLLSQSEAGDSGGLNTAPIIRSCRRSVPDMNDNTEAEAGVPAWMRPGESVQVRPSNISGVIAYVGATEFAPGTWVGLELDTSQGKNDGTVKGVKYFECPPKKGIFVRPKNLKLDKRGREMHSRRKTKAGEANIDIRAQRPCSKSKSRTRLYSGDK